MLLKLLSICRDNEWFRSANLRSSATGYRLTSFAHLEAVRTCWSEIIRGTLKVEHAGGDAFDFIFGGDNRGTGRHERVKVTASDADGNELDDPIPQPAPNFGGLAWMVKVADGEKPFQRPIDLEEFRISQQPGT